MKRCNLCNKLLVAGDFSVERANKDGLRSTCRNCTNKSSARHTRARREQVANLKNVPCADCGGVFPAECMDFDHRERCAKVDKVSALLTHAKEALLAEIAKCDVVCANCHRIRTYARLDHLPIPESSSGRMADSESADHGSNPCPGTQTSLFGLLGL